MIRVVVVVLVLVIASGCGGSTPRTDWVKLEHSVDSICACKDLACVDAESAGWDDLPWPALPTARRPAFERAVALSTRGNLCQLRHRAKPELDLFAQWADRMCQCTDAACAIAVDDETVAWIEQNNDQPVTSRILQVTPDVIIKLDVCHAKATGAPVAAAITMPDTIPERIAATADRICACSTMLCAELFDSTLVDWIGSQYRNQGYDPPTGMILTGPARQANATYKRCHVAKSTKWPHRSRLLNQYGIDPDE
jgi:hypothetical protein